MTPSLHRLSTSVLPSLQNTLLGGENSPAKKPRWSKTFFQCCFKCCSRLPWNKMCISPGLAVLRTWPKRALEVSCPLPSSLESIFQALPAGAGHEYLPVGRSVYQSQPSVQDLLSHTGWMQPDQRLTPPGRCKTGDRNVSLSQQGY